MGVAEDLRALGFEEIEAEAYQVLVKFGFRTAGQIKAYMENVEFEEVINALDNLSEKGLVTSRRTKTPEATVYIPVSPQIALSANIASKLQGKLKELSDKVNNQWTNAENAIDSNYNKFKTSQTQLLSDVNDRFSQVMNERLGQLDSLKEAEASGTVAVAKEMQEKIKNDVIPNLQNVAGDLEESSSKLISTKDAMVGDINEGVEAHRGILEEASGLATQEITDFANEIAMNLVARMTVIQQGMDGLKVPSAENISTVRGTATQDVTDNVEKLIAEIQSIGRDHIEEAEGSLLALQDSTKEAADNSAKAIDDSLNSMSEMVGNTVKSAEETTKTLISSFSADLKKDAQAFQKSMQSAVKTTQNTAVKSLTDILKKTAGDIKSGEKAMSSGVKSSEKELYSQLSDLEKSLDAGLQTNIGNAKDQNSNFTSSLSDSTNESVNSLISQLEDLQKFITDFLSGNQESMGSSLDSLIDNVRSSLDEIITAAENERKEVVKNSSDQLAEIGDNSEELINTYHKDLGDALLEIENAFDSSSTDSKNALKDRIEGKLKEIEERETEFKAMFSEHIEKLNADSENLLKDADSSKQSMLESLDKALKQAKDDNFDKFKTSINNSYEKFGREGKRLQEYSTAEFERYTESFRSNITGLMNEVPTRIEDLFTNHDDRLHNFEQKFTSFKTRVTKMLADMLALMEQNPKILGKKKEQQNAKIEEQRLMVSDFQRLAREIEPFIRNELDESEVTREEVLGKFNRTVQNEVEGIDDLFEDLSKSVCGLIDTGLSGLSTAKDHFVDELTNATEEAMFTAIDTIRNNQATYFDEKVVSLVNKAQRLATGVQGSGQENIVLKTNDELLDFAKTSFNDAVSQYASHVDASFEKIEKLIGDSSGKAAEISKEFGDKFKGALNQQLESVKEVSSKMGNAMNKLSEQTNNNLESAVSDSKNELASVVEVKTKEIADIIGKGSEKLRSDTDENLSKISENAENFNSTLDEIRQQTFSQLSETLSNAKSTFEETVGKMVSDLSTSAAEVIGVIEKSSASVANEVGKPLSKVKADVEKFIPGFEKKIETITSSHSKKVVNAFKDAVKATDDINKEGKKVIDLTKEYIAGVAKVKNAIIPHLTTKLDGYIEYVSTAMESHKSSTIALYEGHAEQFTATMDQVFDLIEMQLNDLNTEVNGAIANATANVGIQVSNSVEQIKGDVNNAAQAVIKVLNESVKEADGTLSAIISSLRDASSGFGNYIDGKVEAHTSGLVEKYTSYIDQLQQEIKRDTDSTYKKIKTATLSFTEKIGAETTDGKQNVRESLDKIPSIIDETLDAAGKSISMLTAITQGASTIEPKIIESTYVEASKEGVTANLNALIGRTKSKIDIVTPSIRWLDLSEFETFSRKKITIVTDPATHNDRDTSIVKKIQDSGTPITVKKFDANILRLRSAGLNVVIAVRDNEEAMIAQPLDQSDSFGIVTQDEEIVDQFSTILANYLGMPNLRI